MLDFVLELVIELVGRLVLELVGELVLRAGFRWLATALQARVTRVLVAVVVGFGAGAWWGDTLADRGHDETPRLFVVSMLVALVAGVAAVRRWTSATPAEELASAAPRELIADLLRPWRWSAVRLAGFCALNLAIGAGVVVGFGPLPG